MLAIGKRKYAREKPYPPRKVKTVNEAVELLKKYPYVFIFDLHGLSARVLNEYRYRIRPYGVIKIIKPTLFKIAFSKVYGGISTDIAEKIRGEIGFLFTDINPAEMIKIVAEKSVRRAAKPGDKAPFDIVVPAGPTNASPGPIISKFGKLKIPTRVQEGKIWIAKDTVVAKAGQEITAEIAEVLRVVGIEPIFEQLRLVGVLWRGKRYVDISELVIDVSKYRELFEVAAAHARNLALNVVYPTREVLQVVLPAAHMRAVALAAKLGVVTRETLSVLLSRAVAEANALAAAVAAKAPDLGITVAAPQTVAQQPAQHAEAPKEETKEEEKKEGPSEEEIAGSLASLF
ncbi:Ribosomal protein L10 [Pyrobaculum oguniense TE7]|uniref:Large ribosomal subunit protein uL10 n=1 Tax=Pyrobaculum oguniense (strain DSM 13380 / JCM 10595 / TE7) TaxID=698757 RepID=H6Q7C5_PYROT|nr:Ribosomal protein L10 [Pyrobaculum oguniense TE7]